MDILHTTLNLSLLSRELGGLGIPVCPRYGTLSAKTKKVLLRLGGVAHPTLGAANKGIVQYTKSKEIKDG